MFAVGNRDAARNTYNQPLIFHEAVTGKGRRIGDDISALAPPPDRRLTHQYLDSTDLNSPMVHADAFHHSTTTYMKKQASLFVSQSICSDIR